MAMKNKELERFYKREWYKENKEKQISRQRERRRELKRWLVKYKSTLFCSHCGISFKGKEECCDFHHIHDKKDNITAIMVSSKKALLKEIKKCIPICANCHRTLHYKKFMSL